MGFCLALRQEFQLKKFGFCGVKAERFCTFQWRLPVSVYLVYRVVLMVYAVFWLGYTNSIHGTPPQAWGAYLTNWTYIMLNIYLVSHCLAALYHHTHCTLRRRNYGQYCCSRPSSHEHNRIMEDLGEHEQTGYEDIPGSVAGREGGGGESGEVQVVSPLPRPPWYICWVWISFNVISSAALMVTIVFFAFLFRQLSDYPNISLENLQVHLLNSVIVFIEHLVSAVPFRLLHVIYPFAYGVIYMAFSVIYWAGDHNRVMYPNILDWNYPGSTVLYVLLIGFILIPLLHFFFFLLHKLKVLINKRWC
ncbi:protein rolling stone-like [Littorina saxatilis]|uniref:Protein rolling stone n=1 Tax=Littorina saxatilis TaxID=31220 RepID=A0AAN9GC88_9CAEN